MEIAAHQLSTVKQLEVHLERLQSALGYNGVISAQAADVSIRQFANLTPQEQNEILSGIATYTRILMLENEAPLPQPGQPRKSEAIRTQRALREFGLKPLNDDVFNLIDNDDIIEIYSGMGTQLYRNVTFCKTCSYNLLDLAVNSWDELYEKPTTAMVAIQRLIQTMLTDANETLSYNLGSFIQKEKFMYASTLRTFLLTPKYISPLFEVNSGRRAGFFSTCTAQIIAEGRDSVKFNIL